MRAAGVVFFMASAVYSLACFALIVLGALHKGVATVQQGDFMLFCLGMALVCLGCAYVVTLTGEAR